VIKNSTQRGQQWLSRALIACLGVILAGCGWFGADPDPAKLAAEQLRQPPNVLERPANERVSSADENAASADQIISSSSQSSIDASRYLQTLDGDIVLDLGLPPNAAWAVSGRALERSGFALLSSDQQALSHTIRYDAGVVLGADIDEEDDSGWLPNVSASDLAFWRSEPEADLTQYQVVISERGKGSRVRLRTPDGAPTRRAAARQVLAVLAEQLKP